MFPDAERLLTPQEVSIMLGVSPATLKDWRHHRRGPDFVRLSHKMIRYWLSAVNRFVGSFHEEN